MDENVTYVAGMADQCEGITPRGDRCRAGVAPGARWCFAHDPARRADAQAARSAGGRARTAPVADMPAARLREPSDLLSLLETTVDMLTRREIGHHAARVIISACSTAARVIELSILSSRVTALEISERERQEATDDDE